MWQLSELNNQITQQVVACLTHQPVPQSTLLHRYQIIHHVIHYLLPIIALILLKHNTGSKEFTDDCIDLFQHLREVDVGREGVQLQLDNQSVLCEEIEPLSDFLEAFWHVIK